MIEIYGLALATMFALSGCGGGGGGSSTSTSAASPTPTILGGIASKGIIKNGRVLVCRIVNGVPEADATCASVTTGDDGSYSVTFSDGYSGPAMVKIMAGTGSTMNAEMTGTDISYGMTRRAVVSVGFRNDDCLRNAVQRNGRQCREHYHHGCDQDQPGDRGRSDCDDRAGDRYECDADDRSHEQRVGFQETDSAIQYGQTAVEGGHGGKEFKPVKDANCVPCNAAGTTDSQQIA